MSINKNDKGHAALIATLTSVIVAIFLFVIYKILHRDNT